MQRICIARCLLWTGVCPLQVGVPSNRTNGSNCFYCTEAHIGLSYTCVIREFGHLQIHNQYTSLCNKLSQTLNVSIFLLFRTARQPSYTCCQPGCFSFDRRKFNTKPNSITLASSELASSKLALNMFGASFELASVMEFGRELASPC